jgi:predicted HTH transcriptional regulator
MGAPRTKEDLQQPIAVQAQESINLDHKDSRALGGSGSLTEVPKAVSAFANSDGGVIVYGIRGNDHIPQSIDDGIDNKQMPKERLEQLITSNVSPHRAMIEPMCTRAVDRFLAVEMVVDAATAFQSWSALAARSF